MGENIGVPRDGSLDSTNNLDLELNLKMMEAMGGAVIHGDKRKGEPSDEEILDKALKLVDDPDRLGQAN